MERVDVIGVTETWKTDASVLRLESYALHSTVRTDRRGEGVGLYIRDGLHISSVVRDYSAGTNVD